jgi:membrane-associated phospholipid phosphatase
MFLKLCGAAACPLFVLVLSTESLAQSIDTSSPVHQPTELTSLATIPTADTTMNRPAVSRGGISASGLGTDLGRFFTFENARLIGIVGGVALAASTFDGKVSAAASPHMLGGALGPGDLAGSFLMQTGTGLATLALGRAIKKPQVAALGDDLLRAQLVSQVIVQGVKYTTRRLRPDGSSRNSFPSGHAASAFATASVIQRHFGWRAGIPAYAFGGYIAASRVAAHRHYLSDVLVGAAVGVAAGRTVTVGSGTTAFDLGVAPASGGGVAITFTKK